MKRLFYFLAVGLLMWSCDNDEPEYPDHICQIPSNREFMGEQKINDIEYEFYQFTLYSTENPVPEVLTPYAFVEDVDITTDKTTLELPYSVKYTGKNGYEAEYIVGYISSEAFDDLHQIKTITISAAVREIYGNESLLEDCHALTDIYCPKDSYSTPIEVESESLGCDYNKVTLHVKKGNKAAWASAREWHKFKNIIDDL